MSEGKETHLRLLLGTRVRLVCLLLSSCASDEQSLRLCGGRRNASPHFSFTYGRHRLAALLVAVLRFRLAADPAEGTAAVAAAAAAEVRRCSWRRPSGLLATPRVCWPTVPSSVFMFRVFIARRHSWGLVGWMAGSSRGHTPMVVRDCWDVGGERKRLFVSVNDRSDWIRCQMYTPRQQRCSLPGAENGSKQVPRREAAPPSTHGSAGTKHMPSQWPPCI